MEEADGSRRYAGDETHLSSLFPAAAFSSLLCCSLFLSSHHPSLYFPLPFRAQIRRRAIRGILGQRKTKSRETKMKIEEKRKREKRRRKRRKERAHKYLISLWKAREERGRGSRSLREPSFRLHPLSLRPTRRANEVEKIKAAAGDH